MGLSKLDAGDQAEMLKSGTCSPDDLHNLGNVCGMAWSGCAVLAENTAVVSVDMLRLFPSLSEDAM